MQRLTTLDLPDRLAPKCPVLLTQISFGLVCAFGVGLVRIMLDRIAPGWGPFSFSFLAVLIATLYGRILAGMVAMAVSLIYFWYFVLPPVGSFMLTDPADARRLFVNLAACILTAVFAEGFRKAVRVGMTERETHIAERDLFLKEFDHRVKNNFASVISLLELQKTRMADANASEALGSVLERVQGMALAHQHLYRDVTTAETVDVCPYLNNLCGALATALFIPSHVEVICEVESAAIPRDRAISIGLIVNELVTNAHKHAFVGRTRGRIRVQFRRVTDGYQLIVTDNGVGLPQETRNGSLGRRLIDAFVRQAHGTLATDSGERGTRFTLTLPD